MEWVGAPPMKNCAETPQNVKQFGSNLNSVFKKLGSNLNQVFQKTWVISKLMSGHSHGNALAHS
jgi:hypothetical protein